MRQLRPAELKSWLDDPQRARPLLLDVREPWEFERCHIEGATLSPMSQIQSTFHVARFLEHNGFENVINLTGGVDAWAKEVDRQMPTY